MSNKNSSAPGSPPPRSGHGAASVIPHLEVENARERPSGFDEQSEGQPQGPGDQDDAEGSE
jgi:hypothetical protein